MGAAGTVMHGCVKVDDRGRGQMLGCGSCVERVTDAGEWLLGCRDVWG